MSKAKEYLPFKNFVVRTPLLPFSQLEETLERMKNQKLELKQILENPVILEAIFLGSPVLHQEIQKYLDQKTKDPKEEDRLKNAVIRYLTRMSTRCTPFGLFAGCSMGILGNEDQIIIDDLSQYGRHTRLDMNYLCALSQDIAKIPEVKQNTLFFPNTSIYAYGEQLRYIEYKYIQARRIHNIVSVDNSEYIQRVLSRAQQGARLLDLAELLVDEEISLEEASDFIDEMVESQVLVNELEPAITGKEYFEQLTETLAQIPGLDELKNKLQTIEKLLTEIDNLPPGETQEYYTQIIELVKELKTEYDIKYLFQTDMTKPCISSSISPEILDEIYEGITLMNKISLNYSGNSLLNHFMESFQERYEDQSVPLLRVLDTELGIGYRASGNEGDINPLIDDLYTPTKQSQRSEISWDFVQSFLHRKLVETLAEKQTTLELKDKDFEKTPIQWDNLPSTFSVMCKIATYTDDKKTIIMESAGGSSAANLLGRFCHTDPTLHQHVLNITAKEEELNPDCILAEIVHLPESRIGNILIRPVLRPYEIPYLAKSSVDTEFQLPLSDFYVSVRSGAIKLFSKRLNKEIMPRLSSAHNYSNGAMPVYQFLCDLQNQGKRGGIGFHWGSLEDEFSFLPRVTYKNLVLSLARWIINVSDFKALMETKEETERMRKINQWREEKKIPRYVVQPDHDNTLFVDFENWDCIQSLYSAIKKRPTFNLEEFLFDSNNALIHNKKGDSFTNEFVFAFYKNAQSVNDPK